MGGRRRRRPAAPLLFCGDLNVARTDLDIHPKERKPNQVGARDDERAIIERLLSRGLVDVGRTLHPADDALFTWWAPWRNLKQRNIGWRIDYVVASQALAGTRRDLRRAARDSARATTARSSPRSPDGLVGEHCSVPGTERCSAW